MKEIELRLRSNGNPAEAPIDSGDAKEDEALLADSSEIPLVADPVVPGPVEASPSRTVLVSGRVLDEAGGPLAGAEVSAFQDEELVAEGGTRKDGSFELHVPPGDVEIAASRGDFFASALQVRTAGRTVSGLEIRLEPEPRTRVTGRLLGLAPGQEAEIVGVLDEPARTLFSRASVEDGHHLLILEPGAWRLQGVLYDAAGRFERSVRWSLNVPPDVPEMELDLDLANAEAVP